MRPRWLGLVATDRFERLAVEAVEALDDLRRRQLVVVGDRQASAPATSAFHAASGGTRVRSRRRRRGRRRRGCRSRRRRRSPVVHGGGGLPVAVVGRRRSGRAVGAQREELRERAAGDVARDTDAAARDIAGDADAAFGHRRAPCRPTRRCGASPRAAPAARAAAAGGRCDCTSRLPRATKMPIMLGSMSRTYSAMPTGAYTNSSTAFSTGCFSSGTRRAESTVPGTMSVLEALLVIGVGFLAGTINTIVGSGSLITFPTLLAIGYSPVVANVSNTIGITFGSDQRRGRLPARARRSAAADDDPGLRRRSPAASPAAVLLLTLPSSVFDDVVPVLILIAVRARDPPAAARAAWSPSGATGSWSTAGSSCGSACSSPAIYGGYFGAAQGVILLSAARDLHRRRPAAPERGEERARADRQRRRRRSLFVFFADVAWAVVVLDRGRVGASVRSSARTSGDASRRPCCGRVDRRGRPGGRDQAPGLVTAGVTGRRIATTVTTTSAMRAQQHDPVAEAHVERLARRRRHRWPSRSPTRTARSRSCTEPSGSMTALMPDTDACSTGRPVSAARICPSARCCSVLPERWYERLLVLTTIDLGAVAHVVAHERAERRLEADHAADRSPGDLGTSCGASPGSKS